jgi:hypothetical protein
MSRKLIVFSVFCCLAMTACQGLFLGRNRASVPLDPATSVKVEFQGLEHDDIYLYGRFLVGVEAGRVRLDKRLVENVSVTVRSVRTCDTHEEIHFIIADIFPPPPKQEHLVVLERGQWYGRDLYFLLLDKEITGHPAPSCVEAEFTLTSFDTHLLARKSFRAWRKGERPPTEPPAPGSPAQPTPAPAPATPAP